MSDGEIFSQPAPSIWERVWESESRQSYFVARFLMLRLLGLVYFVGFLTILNDGLALFGSEGLTPAVSYLDRVEAGLGSGASNFWSVPTIFWLNDSDGFLMRAASIGAVISLLVLAGYANATMLALLWSLYLSFVHIGQSWYAFGWEIQLLETGFLAIFLCPLFDGHPFSKRPPPVLVLWLNRWLIFRIMLGAGLIKIRGDTCWRDLTCLVYHYETQPLPNPLSLALHFLPAWFHKLGVLFNYLCELAAPFFLFGPRRLRYASGVLMIVFQLMLIASGNLSFLNWLTIVPALSCFDDSFFRRVLPSESWTKRALTDLHVAQRIAAVVLFAAVAILSIGPVSNLLSSRQAMNTSFGRFHLVNTYGAFGNIGRERYELVFEATADGVTWRAYEFKCKPGRLDRRPCLITPYHYRLDWLLWFAAMGRVQQYPWTVHLVEKLLLNDPGTLELIAENPFPDEPARAIRIELYRYEFAPPGEAGWWRRERLGPWLPEMSRDDPRLREFLTSHGW